MIRALREECRVSFDMQQHCAKREGGKTSFSDQRCCSVRLRLPQCLEDTDVFAISVSQSSLFHLDLMV